MSLSLGGGKSRSNQSSYIDKTQLPYLNTGWEGARNLLTGSSPQNMVAGFTPAQQQAQDYAAQYAGQIPSLVNQTAQQGQQLAGPTSFERYGNAIAPYSFGSLANQMGGPSGQYGNTLNQLMSGNVNLDPYNQMADSITQRMSKSFNENVIPSIRRNSMQASNVPTSRASIPTQQAASQFSQDLGSTLNSLYLPAYQQAQQQMGQGAGLYGDAMNRSLQAATTGAGLLGQGSQLGSNNLYNAMSFAPQLAEFGMMPSNILNQIGGQQQGLNQQYLNAPWDAQSRYTQLIGRPTTVGDGNSSAWNFNTSAGFNPF